MSPTLEVHQFIPSLALHDAVGQHTIALQAFLRELGAESEIYADEMKPGTHSLAHPYRSFHPKNSEHRYLIYQGSTASPIADFLTYRPEKKFVNYHNITPKHLTFSWDKGAGLAMARARVELGKFSAHAELAFTVSRFNEEELVQLGYRHTAVAAPFIELRDTFQREPCSVSEGAKWLFVGRIFPNKAQHLLLGALATYRRIYDPHATLTLVGSMASPTYFKALQDYAEHLGLSYAVEFKQGVSSDELSKLYIESDLFTCASRHEGFCFPLIEAMQYSMPIVASSSTAVGETLGDAGVLVPTEDPVDFAAGARLALTDCQLQARLMQGAKAQLELYSPEQARRGHHRALSMVIDELKIANVGI